LKILVTGSSGSENVGRYVVQELLKMEEEVAVAGWIFASV
jgi:uncharacterized protein YbjT (DUF2867 family)